MNTRPYGRGDREACLALFDGNVPDFFDAGDRDGFARFLDDPTATLLVAESAQGTVVACGGWYLDGDRAGLAWGVVARGFHSRGIGGALLRERLRQIRADGRARRVDLRTTQRVQGFYERFGFIVRSSIPDGFGPGLDRVEMELVLA